MAINFDEISEQLHDKMDRERTREAKLEMLRQKRDALLDEVDALDEKIANLENPDADPNAMAIWNVGGCYINGTRITP